MRPYKPKKIRVIFEGTYVEYKSQKNKKSSMKKYLQKVSL